MPVRNWPRAAGLDCCRYSAIFQGYEDQKVNDFHPDLIDEGMVAVPETLSGVLSLSQYAIAKNRLVVDAQSAINADLLAALSLATSPLHGTIGIATRDIRQILEKLELFLGTGVERLFRGLGSNNILFMAAELLLLRSSGEFGLPLLIIEEPEAHLHPQWQLTVVDYLQQVAGDEISPLQVILTTHSPTLASHVRLDSVFLVHNGGVFPLAPGHTRLDSSDYLFLQRFLDATRANLFFARGVLIVEGDAENMLIPTIAEILGIPLSRYGVSIVNVGHRGLFRYARIFQRSAPPEFEGIRVACLADLDPRAEENAAQLAARRRALHERVEGGSVRAFVAEQNTFEYDLAYSGLADYLLVALRLASTNDIDPQTLEMSKARLGPSSANVDPKPQRNEQPLSTSWSKTRKLLLRSTCRI